MLQTAAALLLALAGSLVVAAAGALAATSPTPPVAPRTVGPTVGAVSVEPLTGTDQVPFSLVTTVKCPSGTNVIGRIQGSGLPSDGINVVPNSSIAIYPRTKAGGYFLPSNNTLRNLVNELAGPQPLKGTYQLTVKCLGPVKPADLGDFHGSMVFDGNHGYVAKGLGVPASALESVPPPQEPVPGPASAIGSHAPESAPPPAAKSATSVAPSVTLGRRPAQSSSATGPWLIGAGVAIAGVGLFTLLQGLRKKPKAGTR